jgi:uncharacterized membrane protein YfcA
VAGGVINALAGGATLLTFPTMILAGLPPVIANASNAVAIAPGHALAVLADRHLLPRLDRGMVGKALVALIGGALGAVLLLVIPERLFILPVPVLIGFATLVFAAAPLVRNWSSERRGAIRSSPWAGASLGLAAIYGGFFGAGLGVILTAVLSITEDTDLRTIKVIKNFLATLVSIASVVIFSCQGVVRWPATLIMLLGAMIGGFLGGYLIKILPPQVVRHVVIGAGIIMTIIYADKYWF